MYQEVAAVEKSTNVRAPAALRLLGLGLRGIERLAPPLAPAAAEVLFRIARRHQAPPRESRWLATARPLRVRFDGEELPAWSWGEGPAVVLAHGWEGRGGQMGALAEGIAASGMRAVAFDAPAHGGSRRRLGSLPQFAGAVAAVAAAVGGARGVVGHSFGAAAALWAVAQGMPAERLALVAPPWDLGTYIYGFGELLGARRETVERMMARLESRYAFDWRLARRPAEAASRRAPEARVLVVHDEGDTETSWQEGARVAGSFAGGELLRTSGLGHRRVLRDAGVVERVVTFLAARPAG
jgi:hypothetical protein